VPVEEILYLRAEQKYVTARTREREFLLEESLTQLETEFAAHFVRVHRNCLVSLDAVAGVMRETGTEAETGHAGEGGHWALCLKDAPEHLPVSRRQWPQAKERLGL